MYTQFKGRYGSRPAQRETPNKEAKMEKTYWYGNGKFQKDYDDIWERLIPGSGPALTHAGEVFRAITDGSTMVTEFNRKWTGGHWREVQPKLSNTFTNLKILFPNFPPKIL